MTDVFVQPVCEQSAPRRPNPIHFAPSLAALAHPFLLMVFHSLVGSPGSQPRSAEILLATATLFCTLAAPTVGFLVARRADIPAGIRRLAYASILSPTLYVFLGVVQGMAGSPVPDPFAWCILWLGATIWAGRSVAARAESNHAPAIARWRVAHGISAAIISLYIFFHIGNHLFGLSGPEAHRTVMDAGRIVYRSSFIEPVLVLMLLFQVIGGLRLAWYWSSEAQDAYRSFQIASGAYLSIFILGHMNSVFIYARTYLGIPTDWNFATGAPTGLIHDPWNIRLVPHYALGVFFVLAHLVSGFRVVLIAHGTAEQTANRIWWAGTAASALIAAAIIAGMCGVRI